MVCFHLNNMGTDVHLEADDARREMLKSGVVAALLHSLADRESWVRWDALDCTAEFAKHGKLSLRQRVRK